MAKGKSTWTPDEIQDKKAQKWQAIFYLAGLLSGLIALGSFDEDPDGSGVFFLAAIVFFGLGSLIKTTWVKRRQVNVYVKDKNRESLRRKFYGAGVICGIIAALSLSNGADGPGGFFTIVGTGAFLIGGLMPIKWVKRAEGGVYR